MKQRVNCRDCENFIHPVLKEWNIGIKENARCKLGKRVIFKMPKNSTQFNQLGGFGYFRYCEEFTNITPEKG